MKIKITIEPFYSLNWPMVKIQIKDHKIYNGLCKPNEGKYFVWNVHLENVDQFNTIEITHFGKKGKETILDTEGNIVSDRAIALKSLEFDDMRVPDVILYQNKFYPDWPDQPEFITNNLYFGYNGTYKFNFLENPHKMYFQHLLEKELIANINNKKIMQLPNGEEVESFEFNGKSVSGHEKEKTTIEDLYQSVINES
jgi:hypothetical protein|tara:strand:- start:1220 stop:1810 length:591 start_codon:yes stop_codon:yes gene_type:complete